MNILAIADVPSKYLWDFYEKGKLDDIDLILSAGDLPAEYLSFLVTFAKCPLLYVSGNHDTKYVKNPPEGCVCVDDTVYVHEGVRIFGLGGSMRYRPGAPFQYTEKQMKMRILKSSLKLAKAGGVDILLTHAPLHGCGDLDDLPHRGFEAFNTILDRYHPQYMIHGHVHMNYGRDIKRTIPHGATKIINAYDKYFFKY